MIKFFSSYYFLLLKYNRKVGTRTLIYSFGDYHATNCTTDLYTLHTGFEPANHFWSTVFKTAPSPPGHTAYKVVTIFLKLETVRLFHCFPKQEELLLSQQSYFLEFSLFNSNYWSHPSATRAECRIRTYKPNKRPND